MMRVERLLVKVVGRGGGGRVQGEKIQVKLEVLSDW